MPREPLPQSFLRRLAERFSSALRRPGTAADEAEAQIPLAWLIGATIVLVSVIAGANAVFINNLRESTLVGTEANIARYSLMLAEQADRSFKSVDLLLSSIGDYVGRQGVTDDASYNELMSKYDTFRMLKEKISGLPHIEAVTMINANGKLINFSRSWPIPEVNVSDRDYYAVLKGDPVLESFVSMPVQNRATATWNVYVARRLNDPNGEFMGLLLGAISMQYFENFFGSTVVGAGGSVSMVRDDGILLARFPRVEQIGSVSSMEAHRALSAGGIIRETSPEDQRNRVVSARQLANYPIAIAVSQTEESALGEWRRMAGLLAATTFGCCLVILVASVMIARWWRARDRAARAAQSANQAKSSFLAMMSHEIRTPMNGVIGLAATLLDSPLNDDQHRAIVAIHTAGDNLLELLNDILDFSKLEAGRMSFEEIAFSPESLVDNAMSIMGPRAAAKGLVIKAMHESAVPRALTGDPGRIRQIVLNLISNAVKFTEAGEVTVAVRCLAHDDTHATMEWSVSDTGIGIATDRIKDLFKDFVQADSSISRRFGGSGLGLSVCKRLIERMGGEIGAISAFGKGSTFRFSVRLPIAREDALVGADDEQQVVDESSNRIAELGRPLRVLVVDDNATNRLVACRMLEQFDARIDTACDGAEAIAAATRSTYDVILMDVRMPVMDGLEATRTLRANGGRFAEVPIIAFTANAFADDVSVCREAGMNDFVAKPVRKNELVAAIARVLPGAKADGGRPPADEPAPPPAEIGRPPATPVFDRHVLDILAAEIGDDSVGKLAQMFVAETERRIARLRTLSCVSDRKTIEREAHSLKGDAGALGLAQLAALAATLERAAPAISDDEYRAAIERIVPAFTTGREHLPKHAAAA